MDYNININVSAQQTISTVSGLVNALNQLTAATQQYQNLLQNNTANVNNNTAARNRNRASLANERLSLQQLNSTLAQQRAALLQNVQALQSLRASGAGTAADQRRLQQEIVRNERHITSLTARLRAYNATLDRTRSASILAGRGFQALTGMFNKLGAVMGVSFGMYGVFRALQYGIKVIADFDLAQRKLQSILGETRVGMKGVEESAIRLGRNSIFGAKGVTELEIELAKMGFSTKEILSMQEAIVNLATATQEELAPSAEVVANILRAFQLPATEATRVVDVMGKAFNDSALDLSNFREAIKYVAPVAKQAGFSLEQTVAALELLSNVGIKGSLAGTGLNNVLKAMMDNNSKLSKSLGGTVKGYDGFLSVLKKAKEEGWGTEKIFGVITQRATAAFSVFKDGVDQIEAFRTSLELAAGTMEKQAGVQLESISYKAKLAKESFNSWVLSIDNSEGVIGLLTKSILKGFTDLFTASKTVGESYKEQSKLVGDLVLDINPLLIRYDQLKAKASELGGVTKLSKEEQEELKKAIVKIGDAIPSTITAFDKYGQAMDINRNKAWIYVKDQISMLRVLNKETVKNLQAEQLELGGKLFEQRKKYLQYKDKEILENVGDIVVIRKATEDEIRIEQNKYLALEQLYRDYTNTIKNLSGDALQAELDARKNAGITETTLPPSGDTPAIKNETKLLELQKQRAIQEANATMEGTQLKEYVAGVEYSYAVEMAEKTIDNEEELLLKKETLYNEWILTLRKIYGEAEKLQSTFNKKKKLSDEDVFKSFIKVLENKPLGRKNYYTDPKDGKIKEAGGLDLYENVPKDEENNLWSKLGVTDKDTQDALQKSFDLAKDGITDLADEWVTQTDRIVEARNNMVDEAQQALQTEIELNKQGFASNVTLKKKELEEAKRLRREALEDQKKAQKAKAAIEFAETTSSLIVAAATTFKKGAELGLWGIPIAAGMIISMLAAMAKFRTQIKGANEGAKYEKGGWIGGKRHSQGGTMIEAETGEFVINRKSASKYKPMIEAINVDDTFTLNRMYLNGLKNGVLNAKVSLDDSQDLKAIRKVLESQGRSVEYTSDGYRIERNGNVTTRIRLN